MTRSRRLFAGLAALLAVGLLATGCDTSPYAAVVNGQVIKQAALNAQLGAYAGDAQFVSAEKQDGHDVQGATSGSYSSAFAGQVLGQLVDYAAINQYLTAHHSLPTPDVVTAIEAILPAAWGKTWYTFSPLTRTLLTNLEADEAMLVPASQASTATTKAVLTQAGTATFSQVCVLTVAVTVNASNGSVDFPSSLSEADAVVSKIDAGHSATAGGSLLCYAPAAFATLPESEISTVLATATGKAATPTKTSYGYQVLAVPTRTSLSDTDPSVGRVAKLFTLENGPTLVPQVLKTAHIKLNPLYGTWDPKTLQVTAPAGPHLTS